MKIFQLEKPILEKIKTVVAAYFTDAGLTPDVEYLDFEPSETYIDGADKDGAVAVYAREINFEPGSGSTTGTQESQNQLVVDVYGFGDPLENEDTNKIDSTVREAQNRAQILTTLVYKAIQDRAEIAGKPSANPPVLKSFGTGIQLLEKFPQMIQKFSPQGVTSANRGACIYRAVYRMKIEEDVPTEPLGDDYTGSDWSSPTYNPGDEPEA